MHEGASVVTDAVVLSTGGVLVAEETVLNDGTPGSSEESALTRVEVVSQP